MDTRNKSGHDDMRVRPPGADPGLDSAEPLETRLNPGGGSENPSKPG